MQQTKVEAREEFPNGVFTFSAKLRAFPNRVLESGIRFARVWTRTWFVGLRLGCQVTIPGCSLLDHADDACVVSGVVVGRCGGSSVVNGAEVSANATGVMIGVGAGVSSNPSDSWF